MILGVLHDPVVMRNVCMSLVIDVKYLLILLAKPAMSP